MSNLFLTIYPFFIESLYCCLLSTPLVSLKSNCLISSFEIVLCLKTSHTRTESHCQIFRSDKHTGAHICTGTQHTAPQYKCTQYIGAPAHTDAHRHTQQCRQRHQPVWRWSPITPMGSDPWDHEIMPNNPIGFVNCVSNNMRWGHYIWQGSSVCIILCILDKWKNRKKCFRQLGYYLDDGF